MLGCKLSNGVTICSALICDSLFSTDPATLVETSRYVIHTQCAYCIIVLVLSIGVDAHWYAIASIPSLRITLVMANIKSGMK